MSSFARTAAADEARDKLDQAIAALGAEQYREGLRLLAESESIRNDPRIAYYRGYAFEKIGECSRARSQYRTAARDPAGSAKLRALAERTLTGVSERCVEARPRGAGRTGWKILGWSSLGLGAATFLLLPIPIRATRNAADEAAPYFLEAYGCEVEFRRIRGTDCDKEGLVADPLYQEYDVRVRGAQNATISVALVASGLVGLGAVTLLTVGLSRPSVAVAVEGGQPRVSVGWAGRF